MLEALVFHPFWCLGAQRKGMVISMKNAEGILRAPRGLRRRHSSMHREGGRLLLLLLPCLLIVFVQSVRKVVEKYNGTVSFTDKGDIFEVSAMLYGIEVKE